MDPMTEALQRCAEGLVWKQENDVTLTEGDAYAWLEDCATRVCFGGDCMAVRFLSGGGSWWQVHYASEGYARGDTGQVLTFHNLGLATAHVVSEASKIQDQVF